MGCKAACRCAETVDRLKQLKHSNKPQREWICRKEKAESSTLVGCIHQFRGVQHKAGGGGQNWPDEDSNMAHWKALGNVKECI